MSGSFDQEVEAGRNKAWQDENNGGVLASWDIMHYPPSFRVGYLEEREEIFRQMDAVSEKIYSYHSNEY